MSLCAKCFILFYFSINIDLSTHISESWFVFIRELFVCPSNACPQDLKFSGKWKKMLIINMSDECMCNVIIIYIEPEIKPLQVYEQKASKFSSKTDKKEELKIQNC